MEYEPVFGLDNIAKRFNEVSHDTNNQFVEGLQYSLDEAVIMTAVMVPDHEVDYKKVRQIKWLENKENYPKAKIFDWNEMGPMLFV